MGAGRAQGKGRDGSSGFAEWRQQTQTELTEGIRQPWSHMRAMAAAGGCALLAPAEVCGGCGGRASHTCVSRVHRSRLGSLTWDFALRKACCHTRWETSAGSETSLLTQACSRQCSKRVCVGRCVGDLGDSRA